jgi:putative phosphoserine phosphatase/1-acylglycerol-3-phosphate O-acyltransferase
VFVFNHQSQADALIMAKLLGEDFTGVAKIEVKSHPIAGPMFSSMDVVFIERSDRDKAIKALEPAVEALRNGVSLVIAPEGTRSETEKLGAFKKGAFHMAMQAGVPIVPVVIHNAIESQPKGEILFRPANVRVEVLPPVDTRHWKAEGLERRVADVRSMFLRALGQSEPPARTGTRGTTGRKRPRKRSVRR